MSDRVQVKNEHDRLSLMAIGGIVAEVLDELCGRARPGMTTGALDKLAAEMLRAHGAEATPRKEYGFPGRLCISVNDEVVHGIPGARELREGDLVKLDLTADKGGYVADATRMALLPPVSEATARLAGCAREACRAGVRAAKAGIHLVELGGVIQSEVNARGFRVIKQLCGHGIGRRTHEEPEVPNYADSTNKRVLREGMVIAIEPIISAGSGLVQSLPDGWTMTTLDGSRAAHYEETVIIGAEHSLIATEAQAHHA